MPYAGQGLPLFKLSPFFEIIRPLTPVIECKGRRCPHLDCHSVPNRAEDWWLFAKAIVREATRDTVQATINLSPEVVDQIGRSGTRRVMIYCAADAVSSPFSRVEIAFPYQVEIKVNQDEVKSNLRGLKNKPGSTRPADITDLLRKRPGYNNDLVVTYALTKNRFFLVVNLVEQRTVGDLVARLSSGKTISKDRVVREMIGKAQDTEIVATSTIMSLKCPLSTLRIDVPCRSTSCNHNQCFDATSFLQLQEQAPTWACPVCNKGVAFDGLQIDQYVDDILKATPKSVDQVTIEPDGKWSTRSNAKSPRRSTNGHRSSDDEDDLVEIQEVPRIASIKTEASHESGMLRTPPTSSREPSTSSGAHSSGSRKRPVAQVVDLTLSDEDEDEVRLPKRRNNTGPPHEPPGLNGFAQMPTRAHESSSGLPAVFPNSQPSTSFTSPLHYTHGGFVQPPWATAVGYCLSIMNKITIRIDIVELSEAWRWGNTRKIRLATCKGNARAILADSDNVWNGGSSITERASRVAA